MRLRISLLSLVVFLVCSGAIGQALVDGRIINGNVFKPVAGVEVHLVNKALNVDAPMNTAPDGRYSFDNVVAGEGYAVDVYDATGKLIGTDPHFDVAAESKHTAVPDIDISKGVTAQLVQKSGGLIENDRGVSPGANISNEQIRVLPLFNRNFLALGLIQPEVHDVEQGSPLQGAAFSIDGSRSTSTNFLLDGVDNVASSTNQAIPFQINEAVREFRVTYADPSLRYGQGSGGVVDIITSNGATGSKGHAWHGSLFGYFNSDSLNAGTPLSVYSNSGFASAAAYANNLSASTTTPLHIIAANLNGSNGVAPPVTGDNCNGGNGSAFCGYSPQSYNELFGLFGSSAGLGIDSGCASQICGAGAFNPSSILATQDSHTQPFSSKQFGGSIGGPLGDRLFFFASYEGTLINNPNPIFERVPTPLDQETGTLSSDQQIAQSVLSLFPNANVGQTSNSIAQTNTGILGFYRGTAPNYTNVHNVELRPDYSLQGLGTLSFRYNGQLLDQLHDDTLPASSAYPGNGANRRAQNQSAAVTYNFPFGDGHNRNLLNLAFTQYRVDEVAQDHSVNGSSLGLPAGALPTIVLSGIDTSASGAKIGQAGAIGGWYDSFWQANCTDAASASCSAATPGSRSPSPITPSLDGTFPLARIGAPLSAPSKRRDTEAFLSDALELHLGSRNFLTVGGEYRYQQNFSYDGGATRGLIVSNNIGEFTHDSETCVSCGNAFHHPSFDYELRQPTGYTGDLRSSSFGVFAEHKFQPIERVTLQFGARYEYFGQPLDTQGRLWNYNVTNQGLNRQTAKGTFDAFDYQCGGGTTFFDSVYGSLRASTPVTGWNCNTGGTFQLPTQKHDLTGMFGASFSPDNSYRNVIRAAVGGYYDHLPASYNQKLLLNRPSPYNVQNPSSIYGQNFYSSYSSSTCQAQTQCGFGLSTLNYASFPTESTAQSTFQNYQASSGASILYERDPNALQTPYSIQISTSVQHRFTGSWSGEFGYVGSISSDLPLVYDSNFANEFYCTQNTTGCNNDAYFPVFTESHIGNANYHSVVARVEGRLWHGLSMHASYTFSKSLDNIASSSFPGSTDSLFTQLFGRQLYGEGNPAASALGISPTAFGSNGGLRGNQLIPTSKTLPTALATSVLQSANVPSFDAIQSALTTTGTSTINTSHYSLPQNPLAFSSKGATAGVDYGPSDFDVRQRGVADFVYNLPFKGHWYNSGFTLSGITVVQTGQPFTVFSGPSYGQITQLVNIPSTGVSTHGGNTSNYISGFNSNNLGSFLPSVDNAACPNIYAQPNLYVPSSTPAACLGNSSRNRFTGPAYFDQDIAFQKATRGFNESQAFIIRAEAYNAFNRANFYNPISEISKDGVHYNPEFGTIRSAHDPFRLQLAVRLEF